MLQTKDWLVSTQCLKLMYLCTWSLCTYAYTIAVLNKYIYIYNCSYFIHVIIKTTLTPNKSYFSLWPSCEFYIYIYIVKSNYIKTGIMELADMNNNLYVVITNWHNIAITNSLVTSQRETTLIFSLNYLPWFCSLGSCRWNK